MTKHTCEQEGRIATITQKQTGMEKVIFGNGEDGLKKKVGQLEDAVIVMKSYNHIKTWILGITVSVLFGSVIFLLNYIWYIQFGKP